jgi:hypothetical protein
MRDGSVTVCTGAVDECLDDSEDQTLQRSAEQDLVAGLIEVFGIDREGFEGHSCWRAHPRAIPAYVGVNTLRTPMFYRATMGHANRSKS